MRSGTHADAVVLPQDICHPGRILLCDVQRHNGRTRLHSHITIHCYARRSTHLLIKQAGKGGFPGSKVFYALLQQPAHPGAKPRKAVHVQRASLQCGGHLQGVHFVKAVHAAAAHKERRNAQAGAHISSAGALRPQKCLVAGKAEGINAQLLHINGLCTGSLSSIYDEQQTVPVGKVRCAGKVGAIAGHVGSPCHHQCTGRGVQQRFPLVVTKLCSCIHPGKRDLYPLCPQPVQRTQNRIMLAYRCDDMIPRMQHAVQYCVQRHGRIGGKKDAGRVRHMEKFCQRQTGVQHDPCGVKGGLVCAAPGVACRVQCLQNSLFHLRRFMQSGGRVIQIDHGFTTFPACVSFSAMVYILVTLPTASFSVRP